MATATVDLALNNAAFLSGMSEAERRSKSFESAIGGLFKRSPFARAERALSEFGLALSQGNAVQGITFLASRMNVLGLAAGIGIGVATGFFKKFTDQVKESQAAVGAINRELGHPIDVQGNLGPGIGAVIERDAKLLETLIAKRETIGGRISELLEHPATGAGTVTSAQEREMRRFGFTTEQINSMRHNSAENLRRRDLSSAQAAQEAIEKRISDLTERRAQYEEAIANAKARAINGDKLGSSLEQNRLSFEQTRAELLERALNEAQKPGRHNVLEDFSNFSRSLSGQSNLRNAQDIASQRATFRGAVAPFDKLGLRSAAETEQFLREKIAADPNAPGIKQLQLQADQIRLFRENAKLDELKGIEGRSIPLSGSARLFQDNLRTQIGAQQETVADQTRRVFNEQKDVANNQGVIDAINVVAQKMDDYWK